MLKQGLISFIYCLFIFSGGVAHAQSGTITSVPVGNIKPQLQQENAIKAWTLRPSNLLSSRSEAETFISIKEKASKNILTKKIYELVIVPVDTSGNKDQGSDESYRQFSGMRIRNIEIKRLNVFGADVDMPDQRSTSTQNILNKTHVNTAERIIRKNLIFKTGDTLSPISLSDNERILRDLTYIYDARISVIPVSENEADILVITKDIYSLGGDYSPSGLKKGNFSAYETNLFGIGHALGIEIPYDNSAPDSPGFGAKYTVDNIASSFVNLDLFYLNGIGTRSYGFDLSRKFISYNTRYAGGISIHNVSENVDKDLNKEPEHFNLQDYWLARSFLLNPESVTRLIIGARYTNNNVFTRPLVLPDTWYALQNYSLVLGSVALSKQRYHKAVLIHDYGRAEDIPHGGMMKVTAGLENNEFKKRTYAGSELSFGYSLPRSGYLYVSTSLGAFINDNKTEQGILSAKFRYFSNLIPIGKYLFRNFVGLDYTRGFDRNTDEHLKYYNDNGFSGFRNDSTIGEQRLNVSLESVLFSPVHVYGFRFAFFGFADFSSLAGTNQILSNGTTLSGMGIGIRVRNDNLIFHTFQIRIGFFPDKPAFSRVNNIVLSGEEPVRFENFEPGPPSMIPYR